MQGVFYAFLGTLFTFGITALGACNVFAVRKKTGHTMEALTLGFAGGVMVAASIWSLLIPGMERAKELGQTSYLVMSAGFLAGVGLLLAADRWIQKKSDGKKSKSTQMLVIAITAHNIPEGMAVGLAFALAAANPGNEALFSGAVALTIGIGIQNYPEGTAVALPLARDGSSKGRAFLAGSMSAIVEPVFGVLAALLAAHTLRLMPLLLAMAAGAMIYVVVQELIPEAHLDDEDKSGTLGFVVGFIIMMILDIALG
jgi:ZIP family zinc transporter